MSESWEVIVTLHNAAQAEILRGLLEAQGVQVRLFQEPAARALGLQVGPLGAIQLAVPQKQAEEARRVIDAFFRGDFAEQA